MYFSITVQNVIGILIGIVLNMFYEIAFGNMAIFTVASTNP
jgi:hypothetical protein